MTINGLPEALGGSGGKNTTINPPADPTQPYSVFVQMEYRVAAVDGADAIMQVSEDLGQGRSFKHNLEVTMGMTARPVTP